MLADGKRLGFATRLCPLSHRTMRGAEALASQESKGKSPSDETLTRVSAGGQL